MQILLAKEKCGCAPRVDEEKLIDMRFDTTIDSFEASCYSVCQYIIS
jgi:hypothetical protein